MIIVIADDFTGAAEIAGVGLRYGLRVELQTEFVPDVDADLLVVDSNTRASSARYAEDTMTALAATVRKSSPDWVYKKVDSVLRGHVRVEIEVLLKQLRKQTALVVPANPSLGRTVKNGVYFVDGNPIALTDFLNDPEFPVCSSQVKDLIRPSEAVAVSVCKAGTSITETGIVIAEAQNSEHLLHWTSCLDEFLLPVGAAEYFAALLAAKGYSKKASGEHGYGRPNAMRDTRHREPPADLFHSALCAPDKKKLFIIGSNSAQSISHLQTCAAIGLPICSLPGQLSASADLNAQLLQRWVADVVAAYEGSNSVVVAIDKPLRAELSSELNHFMGYFTEVLSGQTAVDEILVEGGGTASTILRRQNWQRFLPVQEIAPGVVRMQVLGREGLHFTSKPGSYRWPDSFWENIQC
jgi:uncharacterized protein YgbK (DUF1537 family)